MKVLVVDETQARATELSELLRQKKHDVVTCGGTCQFLDAIQTKGTKAILLDTDSWQKGRAMLEYFDIAPRLADIPFVFYNAPEDFSELQNRPRLDKDVVLPKSATVDAIAESLDGVA